MLVRALVFVSFLLVAQVATVAAKDSLSSVRRSVSVSAIVLHSIGGPYCDKGRVVYSRAPGDAHRWRNYFAAHKVLGVHYIVGREGVVLSSIAEDRVANHALGYNGESIGIELVNDGDGVERFTRSQLIALRGLVLRLIAKYEGLDKSRVFRHSDIDQRVFECAGVAVKRKQDPGAAFNYAEFLSGL